jgi:hypothetical protein
MNNHSDWLNRTDYTAEERLKTCCELMMEAQYWDVHQYLKMMHDSTKRPWVELTDEEMKRTCYEVFSYDPYTIARAIEAKLKEKNT